MQEPLVTAFKQANRTINDYRMTTNEPQASPMTIPETALAIVYDLEKSSSQSRIDKIAIDHPTSMRVLGLKAAELRTVLADWREKLSSFDEPHWIALSLELVNANILEAQIGAFEFLSKNKKALNALSFDQIMALGVHLDNWASVDTYCVYIAGYCWRTGQLEDTTIEQWTRSADRWVRRAALVSTVPLNLRSRGGTGEVARTLRICDILAGDKEDMVVKALSWALRELSKTDRLAVIKFMEANANRLHPRVKREVGTKLRTGKKNG